MSKPIPFTGPTLLQAVEAGRLQECWPYTYELLTRPYPVHQIALRAGPFPPCAWMLFSDPDRLCKWANSRDREGRHRSVQDVTSYSWSWECGLSACYQFHDKHDQIIPAYISLVRHFHKLHFGHLPHNEVLTALMLRNL